MKQGSPEWKAARVGKVTASRIVDVIAKGKSGESASRANYKAQLIAEILTGEPQNDCFVSNDMLRGVEQEEFARAAYETTLGLLVDEVGLIDHPKIARSSASPDGIVCLDGLVEIKCPKTATHIATLLNGDAPAKYIPQMQWQMACTGRQWCDFVSFDPRMPADMQLFIKRVNRDDALIASYEKEVIAFLDEVSATVEKLIQLRRS